MTHDRGNGSRSGPEATDRAASPTPPLGLHGSTAALSLAVLFGAGGLLAFGALLLPGWAGLDTGAIAWIASLAIALALALVALRRHLPVWSHQAFAALGTIMISLAIWVAGIPEAEVTFGLFYVWVALYACMFFPWRAAIGHLGFVGVASAIALLGGGDPRSGEWLVMFGTVTVSGLVVGWLVRRAQSYYRLLYEGQRAVVRELEAAEQVKSDLVAVVSHELRTPLTSIRGLVRTLQVHGHRLSESEREEFLAHVDRESARLSRLVQNLLIASRASDVDPLASARVASITRTAVADLRQTGRGVQIHVVEEGTPTARISPGALSQVLINLLDNATKFARPGSDVRVEVVEEEDEVRIDVVNEADPLTPEEHERMFDPFVQLSSSLEDRSDGLGLGLYVVRRLVEAHGGSVGVASDHGQLRVRVRIPRGDDD